MHSPDVPIYVPSERLGTRLALVVVENLPLPVWVTGPDEEVPDEQWKAYGEFVDAVSYWIWQFDSAIRLALEHLARARSFLRVIIVLDWKGGLLEWLVERHESNVSAAANSRFTMATRIACFGQSADFIKEASNGLSDASEAAVAGRFLIEYVSAQPPSGLRPISLSVYDALLARAAVITGYGMVSDIVHFDIAKIEVAILRSGRLGFSPDQYRAAMDEYRNRFAAHQVANASERFRQNWNRPAEIDEDWRNEVEQATRAEFGLPLSEIA